MCVRGESSTSTYTVKGMTCNGCAGTVKTEVGKVAGITTVVVELATGTLTVTGDGPIDDAVIQNVVEEAGYEVSVA